MTSGARVFGAAGVVLSACLTGACLAAPEGEFEADEASQSPTVPVDVSVCILERGRCMPNERTRLSLNDWGTLRTTNQAEMGFWNPDARGAFLVYLRPGSYAVSVFVADLRFQPDLELRVPAEGMGPVSIVCDPALQWPCSFGPPPPPLEQGGCSDLEIREAAQWCPGGQLAGCWKTDPMLPYFARCVSGMEFSGPPVAAAEPMCGCVGEPECYQYANCCSDC